MKKRATIMAHGYGHILEMFHFETLVPYSGISVKIIEYCTAMFASLASTSERIVHGFPILDGDRLQRGLYTNLVIPADGLLLIPIGWPATKPPLLVCPAHMCMCKLFFTSGFEI